MLRIVYDACNGQVESSLLRLLAVIVLLAGCASAQVEDLGEGRFRIDCSRGHHDWSRCHAAAAAACPDETYDIVARMSDETSSSVGVNDWEYRGSEVTRAMMVQCRSKQ